jgi:hypothetical protein
MKLRVTAPAHGTKSPFDWSVDVAGGVMSDVAPADGPLGSEAPVSGYVPSVSFTVRASDANWAPRMTRRFYTRVRDERVYAGVEMTASLDNDVRTATVSLSYSADFGSPDLTPGPRKTTK